MLELILGYNGFGRLTGDETGSVVPGGGQGGSMWGETGWGRLFSSSYGGQVAWLLPAALTMIVVLLVTSRRGARTDLTRAAVLGWGGWLVVTAAVISFSAGIIHEYYTVALAPAIGALVGIGSVTLWARREHVWARLVLAALIVGTAWWSTVLLARSTGFVSWLGPVVLVGGVVAACAIVLAPYLPGPLGRRVRSVPRWPAWWSCWPDRPPTPWTRRRARRPDHCPRPAPRSPGAAVAPAAREAQGCVGRGCLRASPAACRVLVRDRLPPA